MTQRASLEKSAHGLAPSGDGWFVLHTSEAVWNESERFGRYTRFENVESARFQDFGVNIHVLAPGQPACLYHREEAQEDFLVLSGECKVVIEGEELALRAGHFVHCPAGVTHVFVGAGDGPSVVLMIGHRRPDGEQGYLYPAHPKAAEYGAAAAEDTPDPRAAYAGTARPVEVPPPDRPLW